VDDNMDWTLENDTLQVHAGAYQLSFLLNRPFVRLSVNGGGEAAELFTLAGVNTCAGQEDTTSCSDWQVVTSPGDCLVLELEACSSIWQRKILRFRCEEQRFSYEIEVEGRGAVSEITYFGGHFSGIVRWGSGFFWSGQRFAQGFNPEPAASEQAYFPACGGASIDLMGVPLPGRADWFFTPPPFCFALQAGPVWLGLGIAAQPGGNQYSLLRYHGQDGAFYLSLDCQGRLYVDGHALLPAVTVDFAGDEYSALQCHADGLRAAGLAPSLVTKNRPDWWQGPIFCGWGAQCGLAAREGGRAPAYARQEHYEGFVATLTAHGLQPAIVVIDDKWQQEYGQNQVDPHKWPDLPGFIARRHAAGQKVLLWLKAWDPEGLPPEECITNAAGRPVALDPTHPDLRQRMAAAVRRMLSEQGGYGADGFKIDFSARIPSGPGMRLFGQAWGLELMRAYLELIYCQAKAVKPDALVIAHTPHPYLADVVDMIRLNDVNTGCDVVEQMTRRARIARLACPQALIDTDNWPMANRAAWRAYLPVQPELGVPALYFTSVVDSTGEELQEEDYDVLRAIWAQRSWIKGNV
jgi:hypothetical protein